VRHDIAIVIVTICRQALLRAVRSIYYQKFNGRLQILIGVDHDKFGQKSSLQAKLEEERPDNVTLTWIDLGYSTSRRHGGPHASFYGGSLRSALTLLADAEIVMYLDDDDWLSEDHCASILGAIANKKWAFSYSIYADGNTGKGLCIDELESVGVNRGCYAKKLGGFVRPSGLAVNKLQLMKIHHLWSISAFPTGDGEDRLIFDLLRHESHGCTGKATVFCAIDPNDVLHAMRVAFMQSKGIKIEIGKKLDSSR
jgi:hypothetical protein